MIQIQFLQQRILPQDTHLYVIGNITLLGNWDNKQAILMKYNQFWSIDVQLPIGIPIQYKYIEINHQTQQIKWDEGENRKLILNQPIQSNHIQIMSFNIRYDCQSDLPNNGWQSRKQYVVQMALQNNSDFIGMQEVQKHQHQYIEQQMNQYQSIGHGDGNEDENYLMNPIFIDMTKWKILDSEIFWLSDTPQQIGSITYGNNMPRVCTWIKVINYQSNSIINIYNAHLDHLNGYSQQLSAQQIKKHMFDHYNPNEYIVLMGDFNSTSIGRPLNIFANEGGIKLQKTYSLKNMLQATFHNWWGFRIGIHIDYILIDQKAELLQYQILIQKFNDHYPSDHFPILVQMRLKNQKQLEKSIK